MRYLFYKRHPINEGPHSKCTTPMSFLIYALYFADNMLYILQILYPSTIEKKGTNYQNILVAVSHVCSLRPIPFPGPLMIVSFVQIPWIHGPEVPGSYNQE